MARVGGAVFFNGVIHILDATTDTIVAISTPPGEGGIGIVRMSGSASWSLASQVFVRASQKSLFRTEKEKQEFVPIKRRLYYGFIVDEQKHILDEVLLCYMPAPHTYTCEDIVEINAHGGIVPLKKILELLIRKGARLAEAGEFTKRAYLHGRIDLLQAESVLTLIRAKTEQGLQSALESLRGGISEEIRRLRESLLRILAEIDAAADFPEEELELEAFYYQKIKEKVKKISAQMGQFQNRIRRGKILQEGLKVAIIGKPNVGKSSLYNYFIKEERAIVTDIPGTTRDLLMEYINLKGIPLKIIDTAGLRRGGDEIEKIGMEYSKKTVVDADLILFIIDISAGITEEDEWIYHNLTQKKRQSLFIIANKIDLGKKMTTEEIKALFPCTLVLETSFLKKEGLGQLEDAIVEIVYAGGVVREESAIILEARLSNLFIKAASSLSEALSSLELRFPLDMVSIDLREVYYYLGKLVGENIGEEILDYLFSRFCIGK